MKRIALIGPESSGKTTLAMQLAEHFQAPFIPEYARGFVEKLDRHYTADDILFCAQQQFLAEEEAARSPSQYLFSDTEFILAKVWSLDVFHFCPPWIQEKAESHRYDLFLLTAPDLPFDPDPVRENPHRREEFFDLYRKELVHYGYPFVIVSGLGRKRLRAAVKAVHGLT